jgi:hypothetical protein
MCKTKQIQKCLTLAWDKASTDAEASTAFSMARKLNSKQDIPYELGGTRSSNSHNYSYTATLTNFSAKNTIEFVNNMSHLTEHSDAHVHYNIEGMVDKSKVHITVKSSDEDELRHVREKVQTFLEKVNKDDGHVYKKPKNPYDEPDRPKPNRYNTTYTSTDYDDRYNPKYDTPEPDYTTKVNSEASAKLSAIHYVGIILGLSLATAVAFFN